jgi:UPF0042 nucleotide-binding protein
VKLEQPRIVFVAGLSGSGKTTAMAALEDLGFYCVDNLPPMLIKQFLDLCTQSTPPVNHIALAIDTREPSFLKGVPEVIHALRDQGTVLDLVFLDSDNETLVDRYRETRRVHPLSPSGNVQQGIERERELLVEVARLADMVVDTSQLNVHQLRETVVRHIVGASRATVVNVLSFGYRFGPPRSAELLFDVRFLPNPHFEPALRPHTGEHPAVAEYVLKHERTEALLDQLRSLLGFLLPLYDEEGKAYLTIGIGCTGGRHRSVALAERLAQDLRSLGREVNVTHRDAEKPT